MNKKLLGSGDERVAAALRLLWDLDTVLAGRAADRVGILRSADRAKLAAATAAMRDALTVARPHSDAGSVAKLVWPPR